MARTAARLLALLALAPACEWLAGIGDVRLVPDGGAADGSAEPASGCPTTGTTMVRIDWAPDAAFCIDEAEVTAGQLAQYLAAHPSAQLVEPPACTRPAATNPPRPIAGSLDLPATDLNFCYAWDLCRSLGKRLCGALGGGHAQARGVGLDPTSEWDYVCSNGLRTTYAYGDTYDAGACRASGGAPAPVRSSPACHGTSAPFDRVRDMSGNMAEFDDSATDYQGGGPDPVVRAKGGDFGSGSGTRCSAADEFGMYTWMASNGTVGFRCCADVLP